MASTKFNPNQQFSPVDLDALIREAAVAPFAPDLLEADEALWGGFWQFDVISPGYALPALELALLRAVRLDRLWPQNASPPAFLAALRTAILHPQTGVWTLSLVDAPLAVLAAPATPTLMTVVWYGLKTAYLHAGYRTAATAAHFAGMRLQRPPGFELDSSELAPPDWLREYSTAADDESAVARLDSAILQWRSGKR